MCLGPALIFQLAILVILIIGAVMLLRLLLPALGLGEPFGQIIRIVVGVVVAIIVVIFVWKLAECSGLMRLG